MLTIILSFKDLFLRWVNKQYTEVNGPIATLYSVMKSQGEERCLGRSKKVS